MHVRLGDHQSAAILSMSLLGVLGLSGTVGAEPVTVQDTEQAAVGTAGPVESILDTSKLSIDDLTGQNKAVQRPRPVRPAPATSAAALPSAKPDPSLGAEIRSSVKESVRPQHDQMVESGAVDAWKELKADLGLGKGDWREEDANAGNPKAAAPSDGPNAARWQEPEHRPKTAAQAQMDRELATHMLEKLIDEVKPWAISLLALYLLGYLIKAGIGHSQRRSIRRRERETRRALRRASGKAASTKPEA